MMQTLQLLGIPLAGEAHHPDFPIKEGNPKGYYDMPFYNLMTGFGDFYKGKAVKLFGTALPKIKTPSNVTGAIVCVRRDTEEQDKSTRRLLNLEIEYKSECDSPVRKMVIEHVEKMTDADISKVRRRTYRQTYEYLEHHNIPYIKVAYEDMLYKTKSTIETVTEFLKLSPNKQKLLDAEENVDV
jgi:hypothetical protein